MTLSGYYFLRLGQYHSVLSICRQTFDYRATDDFAALDSYYLFHYSVYYYYFEWLAKSAVAEGLYPMSLKRLHHFYAEEKTSYCRLHLHYDHSSSYRLCGWSDGYDRRCCPETRCRDSRSGRRLSFWIRNHSSITSYCELMSWMRLLKCVIQFCYCYSKFDLEYDRSIDYFQGEKNWCWWKQNSQTCWWARRLTESLSRPSLTCRIPWIPANTLIGRGWIGYFTCWVHPKYLKYL